MEPFDTNGTIKVEVQMHTQKKKKENHLHSNRCLHSVMHSVARELFTYNVNSKLADVLKLVII